MQVRCHAARAVGCGDPPDPDQSGFAGTVYLVQVCKEHDPDPRRSMPMPRPPGSVPIGSVRGARMEKPRNSSRAWGHSYRHERLQDRRR